MNPLYAALIVLAFGCIPGIITIVSEEEDSRVTIGGLMVIVAAVAFIAAVTLKLTNWN